MLRNVGEHREGDGCLVRRRKGWRKRKRRRSSGAGGGDEIGERGRKGRPPGGSSPACRLVEMVEKEPEGRVLGARAPRVEDSSCAVGVVVVWWYTREEVE